MPDKTVPREILIATGPQFPADEDLEPRREFRPQVHHITGVDITNLQGQVYVFLQQLNQVMIEAPETVGGFRLAEFEVSAGIAVEARGEVRLFILGNAEAGGSANAGLKFVFKRPGS